MRPVKVWRFESIENRLRKEIDEYFGQSAARVA
jgi:hypothetical protein